MNDFQSKINYNLKKVPPHDRDDLEQEIKLKIIEKTNMLNEDNFVPGFWEFLSTLQKWRCNDIKVFCFKNTLINELTLDKKYQYYEGDRIEAIGFKLLDVLKVLSNEDSEELTGTIGTTVYNPKTCIKKGSCCKFSGKTFKYCGKYCGYKQKAGGKDNGADAINQLDSCCYWHDWCLYEKAKSRCGCHNDFLACARATPSGLPGRKTIIAGIEAAKILDKCK